MQLFLRSRLPGLALIGIALMTHAAFVVHGAEPPEAPTTDPERAFEYLVKVCDIGPRMSGSEGMEQQQQLLSQHFTRLGAKVRFQTFDAAHPLTGRPVRMSNLIVSWHPEAEERVLLCCHYDTRPLPDRDSNPNLARNGKFIGANDGGSGVALFMELGHHIQDIKPTYGIDFVFFDGEEMVYGNAPDEEWFLGSRHFAKSYKDEPPEWRYVYGVLVDMIGDKNLQLYQEVNSLRYAPQLTASIWKTAKTLGVKEFIAKTKP